MNRAKGDGTLTKRCGYRGSSRVQCAGARRITPYHLSAPVCAVWEPRYNRLES